MGLLKAVLLAAIVCLAVAEDRSDEAKIDKLEKLIDELVYRALKFEKKLDERIDPERIERAGSLEARVEHLEDSSCDEHSYQCGGDDPQCIGNLFVCDGNKDCRNGEDEKHCECPLKKGDKFVGKKVFDKCGKLDPDEITLTVEDVEVVPFFRGFPKLSVTIGIEVDREDKEHEIAIESHGYYDYANHQIVIQAGENDNVGMVGKFDGHNFDRFIGEAVHEGSKEVCARFVYTRQ